MFNKILIANRGEIACRVAATCRRLGIQTVAVYSEADAQAAHVAACDEAVCLGPAEAADSYLRGERIVQAARDTGAQAVHPGYGFLSENPDFARQCAQAGLVFVGPLPEAMQAMGLKAESKRLMQAAGVPLVPGYHGAEQDDARLAAEAERIGYPLLIKASAGGGGKGMREVHAAADFAAALASCRREARSSFGNDAVLLERLVRHPRHIEIQVFADMHGHSLWLAERDCSMQRRHQKVVEEAPAPGLPQAMREAMGAAAVAAAQAVGYVGAGTVEFIVECDENAVPQNFYFMEMNTRLQVEHPVTEAITGLDLVEWQLRVAAGEPLPLAQDEVRTRGHAIEARIYAEHPEAGFLPSTGVLERLALPPHTAFAAAGESGIRIDSGVREADAITPYYDPMIAKLIAWAPTRAQALLRLRQALAATHIAGVQTNVQFLHRLLGLQAFAAAVVDTGLIARHQDALMAPPAIAPHLACAAVVGALLEDERRAQTDDPWSACDSFSNGVLPPRAFVFDSPWGELRCALFSPQAAQPLRLQAPGLDAPQPFAWFADSARAAAQANARTLVVTLGGRRAQVEVVRLRAAGFAVFASGEQALLRPRSADFGSTAAVQGGGRLTAPMPGKIVALLVQPGDTVQAGAPLLVLEAMKMEHTLSAPSAGQVSAVLHAVGDQVSEGAELLRITALQTQEAQT